MKAFGLELRKANTIANLYEEVDKTLAKFSLRDMQVMTVAHAFQKMMKPNQHFSICTVDDCIKITHTVIPKEHYDIYHAAHCMHWNEMTDDFRKNLIAMLLNDFRVIFDLVGKEEVEVETA